MAVSVVSDTGGDVVLDFKQEHRARVSAKDLRFFVTEGSFLPQAIPLIRQAIRPMPHPLMRVRASPVNVVGNDNLRKETELTPVLGRAFRPPSAWRDHFSAGRR